MDGLDLLPAVSLTETVAVSSINNYLDDPYEDPAAFETMGARPAGWGFTLYPPEGNGTRDTPKAHAASAAPCDALDAPCTPDTAMTFVPPVGPPVTSIRWELQRQGLEDSERFYFLANLRRSLSQECGEESQESRSECCALLSRGSALDRVREVVWAFPWLGGHEMWSWEDHKCGPRADDSCSNHPYSTNTSLLHDVLDEVSTEAIALIGKCRTNAS